jgi:hypothetical protein
MLEHIQNEVDVIIEGGSKSEQYIVGALISKALTEAGYNKTEHHDKPGHKVDPMVQLAMYPTLLAAIRQDRPDFFNTPVIISAYHAPVVPRERRAYDRVQVKALEAALTHNDDEDETAPGWSALSGMDRRSTERTEELAEM